MGMLSPAKTWTSTDPHGGNAVCSVSSPPQAL
jgi:hypothetical protein